MTTAADTRQIVSAFLDARADPDRRDAIELMAPSFSFESPLMRITDCLAFLQSHRGFQLLVTGRDTITELAWRVTAAPTSAEPGGLCSVRWRCEDFEPGPS